MQSEIFGLMELGGYMAIRNAAKAIIIKDSKILLIKYLNRYQEAYFELPGGGQLQYETMEDAVIRECREETGYKVNVIRLAAVAEEIFDDPYIRNNFPDYVHRIHHIFIAEITGDQAGVATEKDFHQEDIVWMELSEVKDITLLPRSLKENLDKILGSDLPLYLGTIHDNTFKI
jgi:ADP-ribose pyrophosphatase YjhB (NUDIX family)